MKLRYRYYFSLGLFSVGFLLVLMKAFKIQTIDRDFLIEKSKHQFFRETTLYPNRGDILDRNKKPLALNVQTFSVFIMPQNIKNLDMTLRELKEILPGLNHEYFKKKLNKRNKFTWVARKIKLTPKQVDSLKGIRGVYFESVPKRIYPNNELASQIMGFVGVDNKGLSGVEYAYDQYLRGSPKIIKYIIDNKGRPVKFKSSNIPHEKSDLILTIDKDIQAIAEKYLKKFVHESKAQMGGVGVIDVRTGEILAMANYPSYDPNNLHKGGASSRRLSFATDPIEPGSILKVLTVASALENNVVTPKTNFYCERGRYLVDDHIISEAEEDKEFEWLSVEDIIKYSSNIGTTKIAFDLTYPKLKKTLHDLGIGKKTNLSFPGESRGIFNERDSIPPLSLSNISFGQGVATTGIQILKAFATIANDGQLVEPTLIPHKKQSKSKRVLRKSTTDKLKSMMIKVVEEGTGKNAQLPYFKIAGKTSTAQRPDNRGGYSGYMGGFVGFPIDVKNPFVIYVYIDDPKVKLYYGNYVAAPVFKKVAEYILYKNKEYNNLAIEVDSELNKPIKDDLPLRASSLKREVFKGQVPNFIDLDKKSALKLAEHLDVPTEILGSGLVRSQQPGPGASIEGVKVIKLIFEPPQYE